MALEPYARLQGKRVALSGDAGPFAMRCPLTQECTTRTGQVRGGEGVVSPGSGPHLASVRCATCGRHLSWIGRAHLDALAAEHGISVPVVGGEVFDDG